MRQGCQIERLGRVAKASGKLLEMVNFHNGGSVSGKWKYVMNGLTLCQEGKNKISKIKKFFFFLETVLKANCMVLEKHDGISKNSLFSLKRTTNKGSCR